MNKSSLLIWALAAMFVVSLLSAGLLHWVSSPAILTIMGGTIAGVLAYVVMLVVGANLLKEEAVAAAEGQDHA